MRFLFRLLPALAAGARLWRGALAWGWAGCSVLVLLCWLPWFELTAPGLTFKLTSVVYVLTLTGFGPYYFAWRTQSLAWRQVLLSLPQLAWTAGRWAVRAFLLVITLTFATFVFVIGPSALLLPFVWATALFEERVFGRHDPILFERGHQQLVSRAGKPVVLYPLVPGFNFVTYPASEEIDSTWTATTCPTPSPDCTPQQLASAQAQLLAQIRQALLGEAEERRAKAQQQAAGAELWATAQRERAYQAALEAINQRLGYDVLHFKLDTAFFSLATERSLRQLREPLDSAHYGLAKLSPAGTLRFTTNGISPGNDAFTLVIAQFKGPGTYLLQPPPAAADTSTMQLRHYTNGENTTYRSRPDEPPHVEITRFDIEQRIIEGTFAGQLFSPSGASIALKRGAFSLRFAAYRPPRQLPR